MACFGENEAWVSGNNKTITRIDIHGSVKETIVTNCRFWPNGITATGQGELIYSDCNRRKVNIVRQGKIETLITERLDTTQIVLYKIRRHLSRCIS